MAHREQRHHWKSRDCHCHAFVCQTRRKIMKWPVMCNVHPLATWCIEIDTYHDWFLLLSFENVNYESIWKMIISSWYISFIFAGRSGRGRKWQVAVHRRMPMMNESQQHTTSIEASTLNIEPDSSTNPNQMECEDSSTVVAVENASPEVIHVVSMTSAPTSVTQVQPQQVRLHFKMCSVWAISIEIWLKMCTMNIYDTVSVPNKASSSDNDWLKLLRTDWLENLSDKFIETNRKEDYPVPKIIVWSD